MMPYIHMDMRMRESAKTYLPLSFKCVLPIGRINVQIFSTQMTNDASNGISHRIEGSFHERISRQCVILLTNMTRQEHFKKCARRREIVVLRPMKYQLNYHQNATGLFCHKLLEYNKKSKRAVIVGKLQHHPKVILQLVVGISL